MFLWIVTGSAGSGVSGNPASRGFPVPVYSCFFFTRLQRVLARIPIGTGFFGEWDTSGCSGNPSDIPGRTVRKFLLPPACTSCSLTCQRISPGGPCGFFSRYGKGPVEQAVTTKPWIIIIPSESVFCPDAAITVPAPSALSCTSFPAQVPDPDGSGNV